jgi:hypothetical protein
MERKRVQSSIIRSIGYDPDTRLLEIEFTNKKVGRFINIPIETYEHLVNAKSIGGYFIQHIRDRYPNAVAGIHKKKRTSP